MGPSWLLTDGAFLIFLPPAWAALELSRGAVGQRGVSRGGSLALQVDHCHWPQPHLVGLAKVHSPTSANPFRSVPGHPTAFQAVPEPLPLQPLFPHVLLPPHQTPTRPTCWPCRRAAPRHPAQTPGPPEPRAAAEGTAALAPWRPVQREGLGQSGPHSAQPPSCFLPRLFLRKPG